MSNSFDKTDNSREPGTGPVVVQSLEELKPIMFSQHAPYLMACVVKNEIFREQMDAIEGVARQFENTLGTLVISGELVGCFCKKFNVKGTPTFLFFMNGKERDRILGCISRESLTEFVARNLQTINRKT
ncbi:MAG: thioredoxin family protein [Desulfatibacillum sp.]|nr:thioredoxin family protein [Desulfatibacillum sp.]